MLGPAAGITKQKAAAVAGLGRQLQAAQLRGRLETLRQLLARARQAPPEAEA